MKCHKCGKYLKEPYAWIFSVEGNTYHLCEQCYAEWIHGLDDVGEPGA